jgi:prevent-host-death family protein
LDLSGHIVKATRVSELKASLSRYLARVKAGEEILVTEHGRPVAKLVPIAGAEQADDDRLAALERAGVVRIGAQPLPAGFWRRTRPADPAAAARAALIAERRDGR